MVIVGIVERAGMVVGVIVVLLEEDVMTITAVGPVVHQGIATMITVVEDVIVVLQGTAMMTTVEEEVVLAVQSTGTEVGVHRQGGIVGTTRIIEEAIGITVMLDVVVVMIETTGTTVDTSKNLDILVEVALVMI